MRARPERSGFPVWSVVAVALLAGFAGCLGGSGGVADATEGDLSVHFVHVGQGASVLVVGPTRTRRRDSDSPTGFSGYRLAARAAEIGR